MPQSLHALPGFGGGSRLTHQRSISSKHARAGSILARRRLAAAGDDAEWTSDPGKWVQWRYTSFGQSVAEFPDKTRIVLHDVQAPQCL